MEKIIRIEEGSFQRDKNDWSSFDGYLIVTDKQTIKFGISNGESCCEDWGHFITNDDTSEFVGASIVSVKIVDECMNKEKAPEIYEGGVMFLDIETDKGVLQFTAYNSHNGHYVHYAVVISEQLNHEECL